MCQAQFKEATELNVELIWRGGNGNENENETKPNEWKTTKKPKKKNTWTHRQNAIVQTTEILYVIFVLFPLALAHSLASDNEREISTTNLLHCH